MSEVAGSPVSVVEYGPRRLVIVGAIMLATLMQTLDSTIITVALPYIQGNLGATLDEATWVTTGFIIANVIVIPLTPWLQRRFGRKQYFITSILGFTLASFLCGIAGSLDQLIVYRVIQGAFGGGLLAVAQPLIRETFPESELGLSQGIFTVAAIFGPALGPTLGGVLTDQLSWRWIFDINLPFGIIAAALLWIFLRNPAEPERIPGDPIGISLLVVGLGSLQYVLDEGERNDWFNDGGIIACSLAAMLGLATFVTWELRGTPHPIVALRAFKTRSIAVGSAIGLAIGFPLFGAILMLPQYVSALLGYTATLSGLLVLIRAAPIALFTPLVGIVAQNPRVDARYLLGGGAVIVALGTLWQALVMTSDTPFVTLAFPLVLQGIGTALLVVPLLVNVLGSVAQELSAPAAAFLNLSLQLGGSIASALLVTVFDRRLEFHLWNLAGTITLGRPQIAQLVNAAGPRSRDVLVGLSLLVQQQTSAMAFADVFVVIAAATFLVIPLLFGLRRASSTGPVSLTLE